MSRPSICQIIRCEVSDVLVHSVLASKPHTAILPSRGLQPWAPPITLLTVLERVTLDPMECVGGLLGNCFWILVIILRSSV
jgi:hypothetical protein